MTAPVSPSTQLTVDSGPWAGAAPRASGVVSTWNREHLLPDLLAALEAQRPPEGGFEVIVVDNGSTDATFELLGRVATESALAFRAVRLDENRGPGPARNVAARAARGELLVFTDDDCVPDPDWVSSMVAAMADPSAPDLVQGRVLPVASELEVAGPWDRSMTIHGPTPWFQTCNIAYRTDAFHRVGGFPSDPLASGAARRAFGEDTLLALAVIDSGGTCGFVSDALVSHRVLPSTFLAQVRDRRNAVGMPGLARHASVRAALTGRVFLSPVSRRYDLAVAALAVAVVARRPWALVGVLPWARTRLRAARRGSAGPASTAVALAGWFVLDGVVAASLVEGSVRHRCLIV